LSVVFIYRSFLMIANYRVSSVGRLVLIVVIAVVHCYWLLTVVLSVVGNRLSTVGV
jgi:hypothetical protein